jgi:hypothetical protein
MNRKILAVWLASLIIAVSLGALIAYATSPSSSLTVESGIYPGAPSYTVWVEGSSYFVKDANGLILTCGSGTNATEVYENARDSISNGEIHFLKGTYTFPRAIWPKSNIVISGEGIGTEFRGSGSDPIIKLDATVAIYNVVIKDIFINGVDKSRDGIHLNGVNETTAISFSSFQGITIRNCATGFYMMHVKDSRFYDISVRECVAAYYLDDGQINNQYIACEAMACTTYGLYLNLIATRNEGLEFIGFHVIDCNQSLVIKDGLKISFSASLFDLGSFPYYTVHIGGGEDISFTDVWFDGLGGSLTQVYLGNQYSNLSMVSFSNCHILNMGGNGMQIQNTTTNIIGNITFVNTFFEKNGDAESGCDIFIQGATNVKLTNVFCTSANVQYGLYQSGVASSSVIINSDFHDGIIISAGTSHVNLCYNGTTWVP